MVAIGPAARPQWPVDGMIICRWVPEFPAARKASWKTSRLSPVSPPGPRIEYLKNVGFLTADEEAAYRAAWGALSAGAHPGVPARDEARIGLILALVFGQRLLLKFANWKANQYRRFV